MGLRTGLDRCGKSRCTEIRSPDRPGPRQSLYRLRYPAHCWALVPKNKLNGTYVYRHKHNYIPCSTFTVTKVQLHVSAISVGHLQVVHEALNDKLYLHVSGGDLHFVGWGGCEISFCVCGKGCGSGLFRGCC